jgi:hypothetical protein
MEAVVPLHAPEIEDQGAQNHDHRDEIELAGEELATSEGRQLSVSQQGDHVPSP